DDEKAPQTLGTLSTGLRGSSTMRSLAYRRGLIVVARATFRVRIDRVDMPIRSACHGCRRTDHDQEQLRTQGYDEPARSRGEGERHDRVCSYPSCGRRGGSRGAVASERPSNI